MKMVPCSEIVRILSSHEELSVMRHAGLRLHLLMCKSCSAYSSHLKIMKDQFKKLFADKSKANHAQILQLESEILKDLKKKQSGS